LGSIPNTPTKKSGLVELDVDWVPYLPAGRNYRQPDQKIPIYMLLSKFVEKNNIKLSDIELDLCRKATEMMAGSIDVHHNESHIYRMLDYLEEFLATEEYRKSSKDFDLKVIFISILWHDIWRAKRSPENVVNVLRDALVEGIFAALYFQKEAKIAGLDEEIIKKVKYIIRKHSKYQLLPIKTKEAKIMIDIDVIDSFSLDRVYLLEKKYLYDRPVSAATLKLVKYATRVFVVNKTSRSFYSQWAKERFLQMKEILLAKAYPEIGEYEQMLKALKRGNMLEYERQLCFLREKYINRSEEIRIDDPF
jgi:hypothetical protein